MKKIFIITSIILLSACVNLQFDSMEYDHYVSIAEMADSAVLLCGSPQVIPEVNRIKEYMDHQYLYSSNRESRPQVSDASKNLKGIIDGLYARYQTGTPSKGYCQEKLRNVSLGSITIVRALGRL